jgi:nitroreductase
MVRSGRGEGTAAGREADDRAANDREASDREASDQAAGDRLADVEASAFETLEALMASRFSCRGFLPRPVPREDIERILSLAQRTASWCNAQPWQLVITSGEATARFRQRLLEGAGEPGEPDFAWPREYRDVYLQRRRECGFALYQSVGVARGDREGGARQHLENYRLFGAPHVAIVTSPESLGVYGAIDCGAYVSNFMLAARSLGIACIAQAALAWRPNLVREHLGLPPDRLVVCGISFGYEDPDHPANRFRTVRAGLEEAVTWVGEASAG